MEVRHAYLNRLMYVWHNCTSYPCDPYACLILS